MVGLPERLLRRFHLVRELGSGGGGVVYLVEDRAGEPGPKALKVVRRLAGDARAKLLRREFDALRKIRHPGLVEVLDFGEDPGAGLVWFTSQFIGGPDLHEASAGWGSRDIEEALRTLAETLQFLHERGILHNDLKPSNVRVPAGPRSAKLLDFGLASPLSDGPLAGGTPPYMPPERLASRGSSGSVRADLYGLGAVIYRCATHRLPFEAEEPKHILTAMSSGLIPPRVLRSDLPHYLAEIISRLLQPSPRDRPGSAGEVLSELDRARPRVHRQEMRRDPLLPAAPFLGREGVVEDLRRRWADVQKGAGPERVLLLAEAGMGKSRLLREFTQQLELDRAAVVAVQAHRDAPRPWALVADVSRRLAALPRSPAAPPAIEALVAPRQEGGDEILSETVEAFVAYARSCAEAGPLAVVIDDLGWGDPRSVAALCDLVRPGGGSRLLMLLASAREEPSATDLVEIWDRAGWRVERLGPLMKEDQTALLTSLFTGGSPPPELVQDALLQAGGNPLALEEIARLWVESGTVRREGGAWKRAPGGSPPIAGGPLQLIATRLAALSPAALGVVTQVALHGRPLVPEAIGRLAPDAERTLSELRRARLLVETDRGIDVAHPVVRQAALDRLPEADAPAHHLVIARALERLGAPTEELWQHLLRGGATETGLRHALAAGLRAEVAEDFHTGRAILEEVHRVIEGAPDAMPPGDRARLAASLGICLRETGSPRAGRVVLERALVDAPPLLRSGLLVQLGRTVTVAEDDSASAEEALWQAWRGTSDARIRLEAATALFWAIESRVHEARDLVHSSRPLAEQMEKDEAGARTVAEFRMVAAFAERNVGGPAAGTTDLAAARRVAERAGLQGLAVLVRTYQANACFESARIDEALREYAALEEVTRHARGTLRGALLAMHHARALHRHGDSAAAHARLTECLAWVMDGQNGRRNTKGAFAEVMADLADAEALVHAADVARDFLAGRRAAWLETAVAAGMLGALWLGVEPPPEVLSALDMLHAAGVAPCDRPEIEIGLGVRALSNGDAGSAVDRMRAALESAVGFMPVLAPRCGYFLAYALASAGKIDEARQAAMGAESGQAGLGNHDERARAGLLAQALDQGRFRKTETTVYWLSRIDAALVAAASDPDVAGALVIAVAAAAGATAVWLLSDGTPPEVVKRAGPCASGEPLAWRAAVVAAFASGVETDRPGVGLAIPLSVGGRGMVLILEDRSWPQAFSVEAATAARQAVARVLELGERRQLGAELATLRRVLETTTTRGVAATAPTIDPAPRRRRPLTRSSRLVELSLGPVELRHQFERIVGRSEPMRRVLQVLDRVSDLDTNVLVMGETGTGKELVARALHEQGRRAGGPFVAVNCSAVPITLAESEFFGHAPGAFTGAGRSHHAGYFEQAARGTLFLDEIGELELTMQAKLLRAIEERQIRPLGGAGAIEVDARVVAATHRDLRNEVSLGRFRADLYFRLAVVEVRLPPLRERPEDIPSLVRHLLSLIAESPPTVSPEALEALTEYSWTGNVRELRNELERAAAFSASGVIGLQNLSQRIREALRGPSPRSKTLRQALETLERRMIADSLREASGNKTKAALALGVSRVGLHLKMQRRGMLPRARERSRR